MRPRTGWPWTSLGVFRPIQLLFRTRLILPGWGMRRTGATRFSGKKVGRDTGNATNAGDRSSEFSPGEGIPRGVVGRTPET